jgi:hypothetical protein
VAKEKDLVSKAFVEALMTALDAPRSRDLARCLGVAGTDEETQVGRWVRGQSAPGFHNTMKLLMLADWLKPEALQAYGRSAPRAATAAESEAALARGESAVRRQAGKADRRGS